MSPRARLRNLRALRERITAEINDLERASGLPSSTDDDDVRDAIATAAHHHGVTVDQLMSRNREPNVVRARQEAAWMLRQRGLSYPQIGRLLDRDHTTVMAAVRKVDKRMRVNFIRGGAA